jgi:hypothetical protein
MSDIYKIFLTSSVTILGGVLIFVLEKIVEIFFINLIHKQKQVIGDICDKLIFYADLYSNPFNQKIPQSPEIINRYIRARDEVRSLASLLNSRTQQITWYGFFAKLHIVLPQENIQEASRNLIALSNSFFEPEVLKDLNIPILNIERVKKIRLNLKIPIGE